MSDSKHTPGPWIVDGPTDNQIVWSGPETRICFLAHHNGRDDERDVANGNLIAAAPDLLAALKLAKDHSELEDEVLDIVDFAIAKAEGNKDQ